MKSIHALETHGSHKLQSNPNDKYLYIYFQDDQDHLKISRFIEDYSRQSVTLQLLGHYMVFCSAAVSAVVAACRTDIVVPGWR